MGNIKDFLTMSENCKQEYCCTVVRIGELLPIENSDFLVQTFVNGSSIVVSKDVKEGDIMIYAEHETQLDKGFLSVNNLFEIGSRELNANHDEVEKLLEEGKKDEAKKLCGFFNRHGRVRMIRLRGVPSKGFLFGIDSLVRFNEKAKEVNYEELVGKDFDTVDGELFVKAYVPEVKVDHRRRRPKSNKAQKRIEQFDRIIPGEFHFHYDTLPMQKNMFRFKPEDIVCISVKRHGTSGVFSNVKTKIPLEIPFYKKMFNKFVDCTGWFKKYRFIDYTVDYGNVYSSRKVIKNQHINKNVSGGFYSVDVWGIVNEWLSPLIEKGMTVYGEIVGYVDNGKLIQKDYDYGCEPNISKFMPYRITDTLEDGRKYEWNVSEVLEWTNKMIKEHPELEGKLVPIDLLYHGSLGRLYPNIDTSNQWHEEVLARLSNEKEKFGMELDEPLCKNKVPREGICIRIDNDPFCECFKLKTDAFREWEGKQVTNGYVDIEMKETFIEEEVS